MRTVLSTFAVIVVTLGCVYIVKAFITPCPQEDSPGPCYWNAQERGNQYGHSFIRLDPRER